MAPALLLPRLPRPHGSQNPSSDESRYQALLQHRNQRHEFSIITSPTTPGSGTVPGRTPEPFLYGVRSTRIYCRPTCPARLARRAQIVFFDNSAAAEKAGFRACKRCRPRDTSGSGVSRSVVAEAGTRAFTGSDDAAGVTMEDAGAELETQVQIIARICRVIEDAVRRGMAAEASSEWKSELQGRELARRAGLSVWHFSRVFRKITGVTPKAYVLLCRDRVLHERNSERLERGSGDLDGGGSSAGSAAIGDFDLDLDFDQWIDFESGVSCRTDFFILQDDDHTGGGSDAMEKG